MAHRLFETEVHAKFYVQSRPKPPIHLIEHIVDFVKEKVEGKKLQMAVDMGCGSGQCTFLLAPYFENVLGTDISAAQIQEAENERSKCGLQNVELKVSPGETIPVPDRSVQLITICTAAHYMNLEKIYDEGRRVLVPGGVLAIFAADFAEYHYQDDYVKDQQFKPLYEQVKSKCFEYISGPALKACNEGYEYIIIPYSDLTRGYDYVTQKEVSFNTISNYIQSWSFYHTLAEVEGKEAANEMMATFKKRTEEIIAPGGTFPDDATIFSEQFSYNFVMARL